MITTWSRLVANRLASNSRIMTQSKRFKSTSAVTMKSVSPTFEIIVAVTINLNSLDRAKIPLYLTKFNSVLVDQKLDYFYIGIGS